MSTMPASHGHSKACCNLPPVVSDKYEPKGSYEQLGGLKTYVTGPKDATKGLISIYDIFGYFSQTLQGIDILSSDGYKVFIPDWFKGNPCPIEWYPPDTKEKQEKLGAWFGEHPPQGVAETLPAYVKAVQAANPSIGSWGIIGYCWGGKVVSLVTSGSSNPFSVAAVAHPAMVDPADAEGISIPYLLIASKDEDVETIKNFESNLKVPHQVETFSDQIHGFMAARADLSDPHVKEEYARGYETVLGFLSKQWA
ncbi:hypothetical protein DV737_g3765, partial [Chaetothyriales sp. CBS 132003]